MKRQSQQQTSQPLLDTQEQETLIDELNSSIETSYRCARFALHTLAAALVVFHSFVLYIQLKHPSHGITELFQIRSSIDDSTLSSEELEIRTSVSYVLLYIASLAASLAHARVQQLVSRPFVVLAGAAVLPFLFSLMQFGTHIFSNWIIATCLVLPVVFPLLLELAERSRATNMSDLDALKAAKYTYHKHA
eukprot:m.104873 g.104873  ORF g.104873 m.104873 type:complete len:191 (-) comp13266_c0_seq1:1587-2159(-)